VTARRAFSPAPGEIGSEIRWTHLFPDGSTLQRTGTVVGLAPLLGRSHAVERWVVSDEVLPSDIYRGGLVVAVAKRGGYRAVGGQYVEAGAVFSDNAASSPTGGLSVTNARARQVAAA